MSSSSGPTASAAASSKMILHGTKTVSPHSIQSLPPHLVMEAARLRELCRSDDIALSEHVCRPLVQSTALWLMNMGVTHEANHPGVFDKVSCLLHKELPATMLQLKGSASSKKPASVGQNLFSRRIQDYMKNTIRKGDWQLQVRSSAELSTPLRALKDAGKVRECDSPVQGHSGKSIIGRGRSTSVEQVPKNFDDAAGVGDAHVDRPSSPVPVHHLTPPAATRDIQEATSAKKYDERLRNLMSELEDMQKSNRARDVDVGFSSRAVGSSAAPISGSSTAPISGDDSQKPNSGKPTSNIARNHDGEQTRVILCTSRVTPSIPNPPLPQVHPGVSQQNGVPF